MYIHIQTQARKKPKLNRFMDVMDLQLCLIFGMVLPFVLWFFVGVPFDVTWPPVVLYIIWMIRFKIDRPAGYWKHWLNSKLRPKYWNARNGTIASQNLLEMKN